MDKQSIQCLSPGHGFKNLGFIDIQQLRNLGEPGTKFLLQCKEVWLVPEVETP